jgi:hypothetical protein
MEQRQVEFYSTYSSRPAEMIVSGASDVEPPWGVEPQTYALRVDLQVSTSVAAIESGGWIHAFGRSSGNAKLQFVDKLVDRHNRSGAARSPANTWRDAV